MDLHVETRMPRLACTFRNFAFFRSQPSSLDHTEKRAACVDSALGITPDVQAVEFLLRNEDFAKLAD